MLAESLAVVAAAHADIVTLGAEREFARRRQKILKAPTLALSVMVNAALRVLHGAGVTVARHRIGSYVMSLETSGSSITVTAVDANLLALWDAPAHTAAQRWGL